MTTSTRAADVVEQAGLETFAVLDEDPSCPERTVGAASLVETTALVRGRRSVSTCHSYALVTNMRSVGAGSR